MRLPIAIAALAWAGTGSAIAQEATAPVDPESEAPRLVRVSLGDWGVKTKLASELDIGIAEVPLTIDIDSRLAGVVCPVSRDDLQQQAVRADRSCAAKTVVPELLDAVTREVKGEQPED
ncbi:hypothetical protein [Consotaella salsifontis]|uniref:Uncharacterized protein n=1 Tax=Consotaella salsifontis TaxID=1365950 RepID=A0A1T4T2L2_9HYPH|nr:hypothetical protein [Consotaella salsifontis]SKA34388.1 hypothetical protein SAMN05428963_11727 [Consotaella salsifontis]